METLSSRTAELGQTQDQLAHREEELRRLAHERDASEKSLRQQIEALQGAAAVDRTSFQQTSDHAQSEIAALLAKVSTLEVQVSASESSAGELAICTRDRDDSRAKCAQLDLQCRNALDAKAAAEAGLRREIQDLSARLRESEEKCSAMEKARELELSEV
jgi:chromosome segregation ATPase